MRFTFSLSRREFAIVTCAVTLLAVCALVLWLGPGGSSGTTPIESRHGWAGPDYLAHSADFIAAQPPFELTDDDGRRVVQDNRRANVRLWQLVRKTNRGHDPPNVPQEIGDCTSWGGKHAIEATLGAAIANGQASEFHEVFPPFLYGAGRVLILKQRIKGDGCSGAAIAQAAKEIGIIASDHPNLPRYSGKLARDWGQHGPPRELVAAAAANRIKTVAQARSAADVRDAICNYFGVTIASNFGSKTFRPRDGRLVAVGDDQWCHQMAIDGYDGSAGEAYFHVTNSWGPNAHPAPIDDSPPGGFWITAEQLETIVAQGDSWIFSGFEGFPARKIDFHLLQREAEHDALALRVSTISRKDSHHALHRLAL